ncbi:MAG: type II secretion system F family protein [Rhodospirillales bacterium]|nr:type II secretion system F family protein [Rhodospirillales bacterium]MBO6788746.1 type II secretion system F family protein [Rhodospirillales bacterium]
MNFLANLVPGLGGEAVAALLSGMATLFVVYAVWSSFVVRDPMASRAKSLMKHRENLQAGLVEPRRNRARALLENGGAVRGIVEKLNLLRSKHADKVQLSLARAGWRTRDNVVLYLFAKTVLPFVFGGFGAFFLFVVPMVDLEFEVRALLALGITVFGAYLPEILIKNAQTKRKQALIKGLPDALDLLVICAEAGLSLDAALKRVSEEMGRATPEIADEFQLTAIELSYLPDRAQALNNLNKRTDIAPIRGVVNTLTQTEKYGTPLAQSLRVLAAEFRGERMMKAEEKAAKLPATLTVPLIIFILPSLFVVLLGPAVLSTIDNLINM